MASSSGRPEGVRKFDTARLVLVGQAVRNFVRQASAGHAGCYYVAGVGQSCGRYVRRIAELIRKSDQEAGYLEQRDHHLSQSKSKPEPPLLREEAVAWME